jgi:hypothetical protein
VKSRVAVVGTRPETVLDDYRRLVTLLGREHCPSFGGELLLVLDCPARRFIPGASSPPWQLEGGIAVARDLEVPVASLIPFAAGAGDAGAAQRSCRWQPILNESALSLVSGAESPLERVPAHPRLGRLARLFPGGVPVPQPLAGRDALLLVTLNGSRTDPTGGVLAAAPASILPEAIPPAWRDDAELVADLCAFRRELHPRQLAMIDATVVGYGKNLATLQPVSSHVLLASTDPVALDAVAIRWLGYDPFSIDYLRLCHERALGTIDPDRIEVVGEPDRLRPRLGFGAAMPRRTSPVTNLSRRLPTTLQVPPGTRLVGRVRRSLRERLWDPLAGRRQRSRFAASAWGRLFAAYDRRSRREETA